MQNLQRIFRHCLQCLVLTPFALTSVYASDLEGDQLYRVSTIRAAPAAFSDLLEWASPKNTDEFFLARHSQGDHWDLMFIIPLDSISLDDPLESAESLIAFREDTFAYGPAIDTLTKSYNANRFVHVEMFAALPGKKDELIEERRMENKYLTMTGQVANMIFNSVAGSDVDVFTIGFHRDFAAFASAGPESAEAAEEAAKAAGFKDRADISFYLRSLISGHQDTLAGTVE